MHPTKHLKDSGWNEIRSLVADLAENMRPRTFMTRLFSSGLVSAKERDELRLSKLTDEEIASELLINILPYKGPGSLVKFIKVLEATEGQGHIARLLKVNSGTFGSVVRVPHVRGFPILAKKRR